MSSGDLHAGLYLNATPWQQALNKAKAQADHFAEHVQHNLGKKLGHLLGAGAVVGALYGPIHEIFKGVLDFGKNSEDIEKGANKLGLTTDEFQQLEKAAKEAGRSTEEYIEAVKKGDIPLEQAIKTIKEMHVEMDTVTLANQKSARSALENANAKVTEGYAYVTNAFFKSAAFLGSASVHGFDLKAIQKDLADMDKESAAEMNKRVFKQTLQHLLSPDHKASPDRSVNEWQKIGAFAGVSTDPMLVATQNTEHHAEKAAEHLGDIKHHIEDMRKVITRENFNPNSIPRPGMGNQNAPEWNP